MISFPSPDLYVPILNYFPRRKWGTEQVLMKDLCHGHGLILSEHDIIHLIGQICS